MEEAFGGWGIERDGNEGRGMVVMLSVGKETVGGLEGIRKEEERKKGIV
jgi:hypothetical protein